MIFLQPLNVFLYSWRFMREIETEEQNSKIKKIFRWFEHISISLLPTAFISIVSAYIFEETIYEYEITYYTLYMSLYDSYNK